MKKFSIKLVMLALALVLGLAFVGCGSEPEPEEPGILRITNIPSEFNGKYVLFRYADGNTGQTMIWGSHTTSWRNVNLAQITNGSVDIPLKTAQGLTYDGTETLITRQTDTQALFLFLYIFNSSPIPDLNAEVAQALALGYFPTISFVNGRATVSYLTFNRQR